MPAGVRGSGKGLEFPNSPCQFLGRSRTGVRPGRVCGFRGSGIALRDHTWVRMPRTVRPGTAIRSGNGIGVATDPFPHGGGVDYGVRNSDWRHPGSAPNCSPGGDLVGARLVNSLIR